MCVAKDFSDTGPSPDPYHEFIFLSQSIESMFTYFTKSFNVVTPNLYLAYLFLSEIYVCFAVHAGFN